MVGMVEQQEPAEATFPAQECSVTSLRVAFWAPTLLIDVTQLLHSCRSMNATLVLSLVSCVVTETNSGLQAAQLIATSAFLGASTNSEEVGRFKSRAPRLMTPSPAETAGLGADANSAPATMRTEPTLLTKLIFINQLSFCD